MTNKVIEVNIVNMNFCAHANDDRCMGVFKKVPLQVKRPLN